MAHKHIRHKHQALRVVRAIAWAYDLRYEYEIHSAVFYSGFTSDAERKAPELRITGWKNPHLKPEDDWADDFDGEPYITATFGNESMALESRYPDGYTSFVYPYYGDSEYRFVECIMEYIERVMSHHRDMSFGYLKSSAILGIIEYAKYLRELKEVK